MKYIIVQANTVAETFYHFASGQLSFLKMKNFDVYSICSPSILYDKYLHLEGIHGYKVKMSRRISPIRDFIAFLQIIVILFKLQPDIVQGSTPKAALLTLLSAKLLRLRVKIFFMRGLRHTGLFGIKRSIVKYFEKISCYCADQVLATSPSVMHSAINSDICPQSKIKVLGHGTGNGIDTNRFDPARFSLLSRKKVRERMGISNNFHTILYVGRIANDKGILELWNSWKLLKSKYTNLALILVGEFDIDDPIPPYILKDFEHDSRTYVIGHSDEPEIYYSISDLLVLPTYREGMPICALEASSMSLPVVATRVTGCIDAIDHGITGYLVNPKDFHMLADAISCYLDNPHIRIAHGKNGRRKVVNEFSRNQIWNLLYDEYSRLLSEK